MDDLIKTLREIGFQPIIFDELTPESDVCMNPNIPTCDMCLFNGRTYRSGKPWCPPEEREAKKLQQRNCKACGSVTSLGDYCIACKRFETREDSK